jgi:hypothetical protein
LCGEVLALVLAIRSVSFEILLAVAASGAVALAATMRRH